MSILGISSRIEVRRHKVFIARQIIKKYHLRPASSSRNLLSAHVPMALFLLWKRELIIPIFLSGEHLNENAVHALIPCYWLKPAAIRFATH